MSYKTILLLVLTISATVNAADATTGDVKQWYMNAYTPLWAESRGLAWQRCPGDSR